MKNKICVMMMTVLLGCIICSAAYSYQRKTDDVSSAANAARVEKTSAAKGYESIETIEGEPDRPYIRKGLVWVAHKKADKAVKKIKKEAYKLGADAIIDYNIISPIVFGWAVKWATAEEAKQAADNEDIKIFFGKPDRAYTELGPVWQSHGKILKAMDKLKKQARKKSADAIIDFRIGTYTGVASGTTPQGYAVTMTYTIPHLQGIAVKWKD